jgi:hypothetical protein
MYFIGSSFLYPNGSSSTAQLFNLDGYKMHLFGCHIEMGGLALSYAIEVMSTNAAGLFAMHGGHLALGQSGGNNYTALIDLNGSGSNRCGCILDGVNMDVTTSGGALVSNSGNGLCFINCRDLIFDSPTGIVPVISRDASVNLMIDGGFETGNILDNWYVSADGSSAPTGHLVSATVTISNVTSDHHSGTHCLSLAKSSGTNAVGAGALLIPLRPGERPFFEMWVKSSQTFTIELHWVNVGMQGAITNQTLWSRIQDTTLVVSGNLSPTSWTYVDCATFPLGGGYYTALPPAPGWATHLEVVIQLYAINNGAVLVDDVVVNIVK